MKTSAIIQARMGSTRLPGKVLADIEGRPLIDHVINRTRAAPNLHAVIVATTTNAEDDVLADYLRGRSVEVFRGSEQDVLSRYFECAKTSNSDVIVRVTADDPLKDPAVIARALTLLLGDPTLDYCSNTLTLTYPEGLDIEVVTMKALARAHAEAKLPSEREHVTPYIWKNPDLFKLHNFTHTEDLSAWRLTVDRPQDLELMRKIFAHFSSLGDDFDLDSLIQLLKNQPELRSINSSIMPREGYLKSIKEES